MLVAIIFSAIHLTLVSSQGLLPVDGPSTCAATLCFVGTICIETPNANGVIQAKCVPLGERPGTCPAPSGLAGICLFDPAHNCINDFQCATGLKCCSEGCGKVCMAPVKEIVKPGQCPEPNPLELATCGNTCDRDSQCKGNDKCCKNSCGANTCQAPRDHIPVVITPTCDTVKCKPGQKCVENVIMCVRAPCPPSLPACVPLDKPGQCPNVRLSLFRRYCASRRQRCRDDHQCPGAQKCCKTRCGARCQEPQPRRIRTCSLVDCVPNFTCVMKTRCDKQGCFPRPVCVKVKQCPLFRAWINPNCFPSNECSDLEPNSCPAGTICCSTDCGRRCVRPQE